MKITPEQEPRSAGIPTGHRPQESALWRGDFRVHSYEIDFKQSATLECLCRYFQEAAWNHAEALGVGYQRLQAENKIWVLSRLLVKITRYPRWAETIHVHTWPRVAKSVFAMRDFEMFDSSGERMVAGASAWLLLDTTTRKPQRVDKLASEIQKSFPDRRALEQEPQKLGGCESNPADVDVAVRYSDIDVNGHVNNSRYIGWLTDAHSMDLHRSQTIKSLEVNFLGETVAGDRLSIRSKEATPGEYWHSMVKADGAEVCRGRVEWVKL